MTTKRYIYSTPTGLLNGRVDISILRFEVKFGLYFKMPFRCPTKGEYLRVHRLTQETPLPPLCNAGSRRSAIVVDFRVRCLKWDLILNLQPEFASSG